MRTPTFEKNLRPNFFLYSFLAVFVGDSATPMSTLAHNKRSAKARVRGGLVPARDVDTANPLEFGGDRETIGKL